MQLQASATGERGAPPPQPPPPPAPEPEPLVGILSDAGHFVAGNGLHLVDIGHAAN
jgi:hypothetical protein